MTPAQPESVVRRGGRASISRDDSPTDCTGLTTPSCAERVMSDHNRSDDVKRVEKDSKRSGSGA
jgi:hypothetical protein